MKARWASIIFAAGLGAGWLIFGGGTHETAETAGNKYVAPVVTKREPRPATNPHDVKFRNFAKELPTLSVEEREAFQKSLAPGDRAAAIEALLAQAGPYGIPEEDMSMLDQILKIWAGEDINGAWSWCQRIKSDVTREFVAGILLNGFADKDLDRAFALHLEMATENPDFGSSVPMKILHQAVSKDAASFLDLLGKLPFGNGGSARPEDFAEDFDFQQAAEGVTALRKNRGGKSPPVYPTNFLSTWASRDADAAYAWYCKNPGEPFNESCVNLIEGLEKQGSPGAVWVAEKLNDPGSARDAIIRWLTEFTEIYSGHNSTISSIAQAMPDAANRDRFLADMVTTSRYAYPIDPFGYALTQMSTPAARLDTLQRLGKSNKLDAAKIPDAQLQQWGLTRQQVEQVQASGR